QQAVNDRCDHIAGHSSRGASMGGQFRKSRAHACGFPVFHLVPVFVGLPLRRVHLDSIPNHPHRAAAPQGDAPMTGVNVVALAVLVGLFLLVTVLGFWASNWRRGAHLASLDEWGLGGRTFGTWITWFLLGGDLYTAYTFVAVPAAMFALGSVAGFF